MLSTILSAVIYTALPLALGAIIQTSIECAPALRRLYRKI